MAMVSGWPISGEPWLWHPPPAAGLVSRMGSSRATRLPDRGVDGDRLEPALDFLQEGAGLRAVGRAVVDRDAHVHHRADRDGIALEMTWIPPEAPEDPGQEVFDPAYMSSLFQFGYQRALDKTAWTTVNIADLTTPNYIQQQEAR